MFLGKVRSFYYYLKLSEGGSVAKLPVKNSKIEVKRRFVPGRNGIFLQLPQIPEFLRNLKEKKLQQLSVFFILPGPQK